MCVNLFISLLIEREIVKESLILIVVQVLGWRVSQEADVS